LIASSLINSTAKIRFAISILDNPISLNLLIAHSRNTPSPQLGSKTVNSLDRIAQFARKFAIGFGV